MEQILAIIIPLISGAVGGNVVGALAKNLSLGTLWNSLAGIVGGVGGSQLLGLLMGGGTAVAASAATTAAGGVDIGSILTQVAAGGVGGGVLMAIVGVVKSMMAK